MSDPTNARMSVLQPWVETLTFMQQCVLMAAVRGPDTVHKQHVAKAILRWYRRCIFFHAFDRKIYTDPYTRCGGNFIGHCPYAAEEHNGGKAGIDVAVDKYLRSLDEVPHHFQLHFMHAAEILGYRHPDEDIRAWWRTFYFRLANDMHLNPETEAQMAKRLGDDEKNWRAAEEVIAYQDQEEN